MFSSGPVQYNFFFGQFPRPRDETERVDDRLGVTRRHVHPLVSVAVSRQHQAISSDGFEKVLLGTRGPREAFLRGRKGEEQRSDERRKTA